MNNRRIKTLERKRMKEVLRNIEDSIFTECCHRIYDKLFQDKVWSNAKCIGVTISKGREVNTAPIIQRARQEGKIVTVPKCDPTTHTLQFRTFTNESDLEVVYFGLKEPIVEKTKDISPSEIDLLFVPGIIFSKDKYRIGHGGGYYDRFLTRYENDTVSLALEEQIVDSIPRDTFDLPVDRVITNNRII